MTTASVISVRDEARSQARAGPMRILHLVSSGGLYGAEQVILNLARADNTVSYVGALYNAHSPHLEVIDEAKNRGVGTVVFHSRGRLDLGTVFQIRRFLRERRIDILHSHGYKSDIIGCLAVLLRRTRWVATNHVWHPMTGKLRLYEAADAFVLRHARRVIAVSSEIKDDLISTNVPSASVRVIANGIDIDRFVQPRSTDHVRAALGIDRQDVVVTIVGRLSPEKGHRTFLQAAEKVCATRKHVKCLIVGDGPIAGELRAEAARLSLEGRVIFAGFRRDMPEMYALSDVVVNASSIEGLPMTILEAMASGVAIIAARTGGIPDVITDGRTGLLVDAGDVDALRMRMESLVDRDDERRRLATAACDFVTINHSLKKMCDTYRQVYREVIDEGR